MKKVILLIILVFSSNVFFAQSLKDLDAKNGFRHLKLGSKPNQIENITKNENQFSKNPNVVEYIYTGTDIDNIFNVKVNRVSLSFFKNKLFSIQISFGNLETYTDFKVYEFNNILSALERTYGKDWLTPTNEDGVILNGAIWNGIKVRLELLRIDYSRSKSNPEDYEFISGYINIFDKKLMKEMFSSDF